MLGPKGGPSPAATAAAEVILRRAFPFITADVFTDRVFGGNPLAVFPDAAGLDPELMQKIAGELNLSETVFVLPPDDPRHIARLRIFTPAIELPFAGHPTVGTAIILAETGAVGPDVDGIVLEEGVGPVPVRLERRQGAPMLAALTSPRLPSSVAEPPATADLARVLGLDASAIDGAGVAAGCYSTGNAFTIIPLRDRAALGSISLDRAAWNEVLRSGEAPHVYVLAMDDWKDGLEVQVRMFAPAMGIAEDPATGAAATALAGFLADRQTPWTGTRRWDIRQGEEMGRPSRIVLEADAEAGALRAVRVAGEAVIVSRGEFLVP